MRLLRHLLVLCLSTGAGAFVACDTAPACGADSCSGCCDSDGRCQSGAEQLACGQGGFQCASCSLAQQCRLGVCGVGNGGTGGGSGGGFTTGGGSGGSGGGGACSPRTCAQAGAECGSVSDGCGGSLSCGACTMGRQCGGGGVANVCGTGACAPTTCSQQGKNCGSLSDGCAATLSCGTCSGSQTCGGGGVANVCGNGSCTPTTCGAAGAACGSVPDGCGGSLSCGSCVSPQTCGGGGLANQCGASCLVTCPSGYSCDAQGSCVNGNQSAVVLNVVDPLKVTISGTTTLNGAIPATSYCSSSYIRARVTFTHASNSHFNTTVDVGNCVATSDAYAWTTGLRPGTYSVSVSGGNYSALPSWEVVVNPAFTVAAAQSNVVLNVVDPLKVTISGTATLNGAIPATSYCSSSYIRARVTFTHASNSHFNTTVDVGNCVATSDAYAWTTGLRPGTYSVSVSGGNYSALPSWEVVVNPAFTVSAAQSNVVLNVVDPLKVTISGTATLNGAIPATSYCSSSYIRARVTFTHASNSHFNTTVDVGNCVATSDAYAWTTGLRPGTYSVSVSGGNYSALPSWEVVVNPAFTVSAAQSNVVLNVVDALKVTVAGTTTLNGAIPATSYCSSSYIRARVKFTHASNSHYDTTVDVGNCVSTSDAYAWTTGLRPGTYSVSVSGGNYSALPSWEVVVNPAFTVSAAQSNVVLNVVDALKVTVAGTATLNGAVPATSYCSSSYIRARVKFTHASNSHYDTTVDVGNCVATSDAYAWTTGLRPGTYSVSVSGGNYSALPSWEVVVNPAFIVSGAQSNVVLNVTDALKVTVSGTVTLNGSVPATSYCSSSYIRARVKFTHESNSHYDTTVDIGNCVSTSDTYSWTAQLRPGTYSVIVSGGNYSALPSWEITVADRLVVR